MIGSRIFGCVYFKAVPVSAGAVLLFDRFICIGYNMLNKGAGR